MSPRLLYPLGAASLAAVLWLVLWGLRAVVRRLSIEPTGLGVTEGQLAPCPRHLTCVSTQANDDWHTIAPIAYEVPAEQAKSRLRRILKDMPGGKILAEDETYLHAIVSDPVLRWTHDVEVYLDEGERLIHLRSASRLPYFDFFANRRRMERVRRQFYGVG